MCSSDLTRTIDFAAWHAVLMTWSDSLESTAERIARLQEGVGATQQYRLTSAVLQVSPGAVNHLLGGPGANWFWARSIDRRPDFDLSGLNLFNTFG